MATAKKKKQLNLFKRKPPKDKVVDTLPDAIVNGALMFEVGDTVILRRDHRPDRIIGVCEVLRIDLEKETVSLYDDTLGQWFVFEINNPPTLKLPYYGKKPVNGSSIFERNSVEADAGGLQEVDDDVTVDEEGLVGTSHADEAEESDEVPVLVEESSS